MPASKTPPLDTWQEALKLVSRCPICSKNYETEEAKIVAKNSKARLIHVTCPNCQSYFVAMVVMMRQGLSSVGMVTDLNDRDVTRLYEKPPVTTDEILEGYQLIEEHIFLDSLLLH